MKQYAFMQEAPVTPVVRMVDEASTIKSFDYASIYRSEAFTEAMKYFDINDKMTRSILLSVDEADQDGVMTALANRLYENIKDKVDEIDFGTIPTSRGDITKIDGYDNLVSCIKTMSEIIVRYGEDTTGIDIVSSGLQNLIDRTELFTRAYKLNVEMPIIIYNTMALAIVSSVSLLIGSCIEFIKNADNGFNISLDKTALRKSRDNVLFRDLAKFNKLCSTGEFDQAMEYVFKMNTKNFVDGGLFVAGAAAMLGILLLIIPIVRELIFFFYYSRCKVTNYFDMQSALLTMNAYNIENNLTVNAADKKRIAKEQKAIADKFKKIANTFRVETKTGESKATKEVEKLDNTKFKHNDVLDAIPDSSRSVLF